MSKIWMIYTYFYMHTLSFVIFNISHILDHLKEGYLNLLTFDPAFSLDILG